MTEPITDKNLLRCTFMWPLQGPEGRGMIDKIHTIQMVRRRQSPKAKEYTPSEKAEFARQFREFTNAPFGKGITGCETLTYDLEDYNREIKEIKQKPSTDHKKIHKEIPGQCWKCETRSYKVCNLVKSPCVCAIMSCKPTSRGHHQVVVAEVK